MPSKSRTRLILAGLVIAHVVLNGLALGFMRPLGLFPPIDYALFMLGPSQATLLALWAVLGGGKFLWRVLPTVLGVILYMWLFRDADGEWRMFIFWQVCLWGTVLLLARVTGLRLVRTSSLPPTSRPFQFSIRDMLLWTTALAVVLSLLRCLPTDWYPSRHMSGIAIILGSFALVAVAALHCSLGRRWPLARIVGVPLAVAVGAYLLVATHIGYPAFWYFAMLLGLMAAWLVGSLFLVRLAGYCLSWRRPLPRDGIGEQRLRQQQDGIEVTT